MEALDYYSTEVSPMQYFFSHVDKDIEREYLHYLDLLGRHLDPQSITPDDLHVDLGSGPGTSLLGMQQRFGFHRMVAIDGVPRMLDHIKKFIAGDALVQTVLCDLTKEDTTVSTGRATLVTACCVLPYLSSIEHAIAEASRILKPQGYCMADMVVGSKQQFREEQGTDDDVLRELVEDTVLMYYHADTYLNELLARHGFQKIDETSIPWSSSTMYMLDLHVTTMLLQKT